MKAVSVFDFNAYKPFLKAWIASRPAKGRGEKSKIAAFIRCHSAYVSQVFTAGAHLSLEQGSLLNEYMGHNLQESRFFLLLLQKDRAGNASLKKHFETEIQEILASRMLLRNRLANAKTLDPKDQAQYYSSWIYGAVHMLISMPQFQTREAIAQRLGLPLAKITETLSFLGEAGLAKESGGIFTPGVASIYLPENSPLIAKHHGNWRLKALQSMETPQLLDVHYSAVATIREGDLEKLRAILVKAVEDLRGTIRESSPEDSLVCYSVDLFRL
jgi:hypothetical protein